MDTEKEYNYNVYLAQGYNRDHVARTKTQWDAESYVLNLLANDDISPDAIFEIEIEIVTTTRRMIQRRLPDGTVKLAK